METIQNQLEIPFSPERYHLASMEDNRAANLIMAAVTTSEFSELVLTLKQFAAEARSSIFAMGLLCLIIDREQLYKKGGYRGYYDYIAHVETEAEIPAQTLSDAKRIAEIYLEHFHKLEQQNFSVIGHAHKLRFLDAAVEHHGVEAYKKIKTATFREFQRWAQEDETKPVEKPYTPKVEIFEDQILVEGAPVLNFAESLPDEEKLLLGKYLDSIYRIRQNGNEPFLIDTYDTGEQYAILAFQKRYRAKK